MIPSEIIEVAVEFGEGIGLVGFQGVFLEEFESLGVADFLAGVHQRLALRKGPAENAHDLPGISHALELGSGPGVLVVIGGETKPVGIGGIFIGVPLEIGCERVGTGASLRDVVQQVVQFPRICCIESGFVEPRGLALCKEIELAIFIAESRNRLCPEILRHDVGHVAAETVHSPVEPEAHRVLHFATHVGIGVVQFCDVRPVIFDNRVAVFVADVPVGRLALHPWMVR